MKNKIVVIGSANIDMVVKTKSFPEPGETIIGNSFFQSQGGKGANQAVAAARLGGDVSFIARVGDDDFGVQAVQQYEKEGIHTDKIVVDKINHTGVALISVNGEGENKIIVAPGANKGFTEEDILTSKELIAEAEIILLQLEIPLKTVGEVLKLARENNTRVILNPAPAQQLPGWFFKDLFLISPNKTETEQLTNITINGKDSMLKAANKLKSFGVENIVITLGAEGVFLLTDNYSGIINAPQVTVVDTTAAGDVFNGALAIALTNGIREWEDSIQFACNAAAVSVTKDGAQTSAPSFEELRSFNSQIVENINYKLK